MSNKDIEKTKIDICQICINFLEFFSKELESLAGFLFNNSAL